MKYPRLTIIVRALSQVASHLETDLTSLRAEGKQLRYLGVSGGEHVIRDHRGRYWCSDLVTGTVSLCVGIAPTVTPY